MAKIRFLVLIGFSLALGLPFLAFGQSAAMDCCKVKHSIDIEKDSCDADQVAGPEELYAGTLNVPNPNYVAGALNCPLLGGGVAPNCPETLDAAGNQVAGNPVGGNNWGIFCMVDTIYTLTDWAFSFMAIIVIGLTIWGGFDIMMSEGKPDQWRGGVKKIIYAGLGFLVALGAKAIPSLIQALVGFQ